MIIKVKVNPNSKSEKIERISDREYKINVKQPAEDGKANTKVINLISKALGVSYKDIKIKNPTSREKLIEVKDKNGAKSNSKSQI